MLGYSENDLQDMIASVSWATNYIPPAQEQVIKDLEKAYDFLQGLWAEGYFD